VNGLQVGVDRRGFLLGRHGALSDRPTAGPEAMRYASPVKISCRFFF
jgi:hypothetical protein